MTGRLRSLTADRTLKGMSSQGLARERAVVWLLLGAVLFFAVVAASDASRRVGTVTPGFAVMANVQVPPGGAERAGLEPFDLVVAADGRVVRSAEQLLALVREHPPGTLVHYTIARGHQPLEVDIPTALVSAHAFKRFVLEALAPALVFLALGLVVMWVKPGAGESRVFLAFCLCSSMTTLGYTDLVSTHRFTRLFIAVWTLSPAALAHLALTFPARRGVARRHPWIVWAPWAAALVAGVSFQVTFYRRASSLPAIVATYWGVALVALLLSLLKTVRTGATPLARQRARVVAAGFVIGYALPVLGTTIEIAFHTTVPFLNVLWRFNMLFPLAVAYAIVRYNLFDVTSVLRTGAIYSAVTALVVVGYAGALTVLNVSLSALEMAVSPIIPATAVSLAVVLFLNPIYLRVQALIDRAFFRHRYDAQRTVEGLADAMTTVLELPRIVTLITRTLDGLFHPVTARLFLFDESRRGYRALDGSERGAWIAEDSVLPRCFRDQREPITRERLDEDARVADLREPCLAVMDELGAELAVPIVFRARLIALLVLGVKRSGAAYTTDDLRLLRLLLNQAAVALENAKAYSALQAALRRVEILESIRANLSKFVPRAVQDLIAEAPEAPALTKRERDVSVLFVDIAGYTRLSERLDPGRVNRLVEQYFGGFLDEILARGGDVNETAGDGLMAIFQAGDPRAHAAAALETALAILRRARDIGEAAEDGEPLALHVGVNSGVAAVGATKIEGTAGERWTYTASGSVTNVAARLASAAAGDSVLVGPETRRRLGDAFPFEDLGDRRLRNVEEPVRVFRVSAEAARGAALAVGEV